MLTDTHFAQNQGDPDTAQLLPIILCGGSGTRLWPLSRRDLPKQFAPLVHGHSLLHLTLERARLLGPALWLVASEGRRKSVDNLKSNKPVGRILHGTPCL